MLRIRQENRETEKGKYFEDTLLNGTPRSGFFGFGSQCTLIMHKVADVTKMILDKTGLPVINGFGLGSVIPLGEVTVPLKVYTVSADVEAYVVDDNLLNSDILGG